MSDIKLEIIQIQKRMGKIDGFAKKLVDFVGNLERETSSLKFKINEIEANEARVLGASYDRASVTFTDKVKVYEYSISRIIRNEDSTFHDQYLNIELNETEMKKFEELLKEFKS